MPDENQPVRIIARADVTAAGRVLDGVRRIAEEGAAALGEIPAHVQEAVRRLREIEQAAAGGTGITEDQAEALAELLEVIRQEEALHAARALEESARIRAQGLSTEILNLIRLNDQYRTAYGHQYRAEQLRRIIERIIRLAEAARPGDLGDGAGPPVPPGAPAPGPGETPPPGDLPPGPDGAPAGEPLPGEAPAGHSGPARPPLPIDLPAPGQLPAIPRIYPGTRRTSPGPLPRERRSRLERWLRSDVRSVRAHWRSVGQTVGRLANALTAGYILHGAMRAGDVAERYESDLSTFGARRNRIGEPMVLNSGPIGFGQRYERRDVAGVVDLQRAMNAARLAYLATGDEVLAAMHALDEQYSARRLLTAFDTGRRLGLAPERVARFSARMHRTTTYRGGTRPGGEPQHLGAALAASGMRTRPEEFLADVEAYADAASGGQLMQDYAVPLGFGAMMGALGLGGTARRRAGLSLLQGIAEHRSEETYAAKVAAVRRFLGPVEVDGRRLDPSSFRDVRRLLASSDPRVAWAVALWAEDRAARMAIRPAQRRDTALTLFESTLGLDPADAEVIWRGRHMLADVGSVGGVARDDTWRKGPMYRGPDGTTKGSIGRARAEIDYGEHRAGRRVLDLVTNYKEALEVAASGFLAGRGMLASMGAGTAHLNDDALRLLQFSTAARGDLLGLATAAALETQRMFAPLFGRGRAAAGPTFAPPPGQREVDVLIPGGRITGRFLEQRATHTHEGIDVAAPAGTPIHAPRTGTVARVYSSPTAGNVVEITHPGGYTTRYLHLQAPARIVDPTSGQERDVRRGDPVTSGMQIGTVGSTGRSTGPHLHFEARQAGQVVDPATFLRETP